MLCDCFIFDLLKRSFAQHAFTKSVVTKNCQLSNLQKFVFSKQTKIILKTCPNALITLVPKWPLSTRVPLECPWSAFAVPNFPSSSAGVPKFPLNALLVKMSVTLQEMDSLIVLWGF